eukprot:CAMPEP_0113308264 /NCGR_PEP_ID=MMETSP0010_2-20120614/6768_1 /TAXON_ID=216773 ORGANISM="Corethron hystrix, Strain 308" /NCGR_SAMPLE_ID=MMETSP0010_2 /ASSEMBLY_ACC=CAM_ASM_000155 /LENGTH=488 /DNA_ID=CAMNT_0000163263 /DNA_START=176 /DNA_END=1639 /DNA_ORIENTATION=- /assembly_acc=CAM_ASM_000155
MVRIVIAGQIAAIFLQTILIPFTIVRADDRNHRYENGDRVNLWVNKVGPYANPQETYPYYSLPYCHPEDGHKTDEADPNAGIAEILAGHSLRLSGHPLFFANDEKSFTECKRTLTQADADSFIKAVKGQWFYQMYLDDLPVWGMVGEENEDEGSAYVYTERRLTIAYNTNRIVEVNMTSQGLEEVKAGKDISFTMAIEWNKSSKSFDKRFERYLDNDFFKHQIHWFSIFNSFMMVIFLCGLVALILIRTLKKDFSKYSREIDEDMESLNAGNAALNEDSGWKQVHGDVFRSPPFLELFSALVGSGWQLFFIMLTVILFAVAGPIHGDVYEERGEVISATIVVYVLSSITAGYYSGAFYRKYAAKSSTAGWQSAMSLTLLFLPTVAASVMSILNCIALYYGTANVIPFMVILKCFAIWIFLSIPLTVVGTLLGRHSGKKTIFPCRVNSIPRSIPDAPWYGQPLFLVPLAGLLPFGSIFIELYYVMTSVW